MVDLAEPLDGFVIQLDLLPIDVLAAVVVYLNLGQAAHIFEHFVVVMAFRNAHGDHNDNRTDAHNDAHNGIFISIRCDTITKHFFILIHCLYCLRTGTWSTATTSQNTRANCEHCNGSTNF